MDERTFWQLIDEIDRPALLDGNEDRALEPLRKRLATLSAEDLEGFEEILSWQLFALDGRRYADAAGASGQSDDAFLYARAFVVARGKQFYDAVLADPSKMPKSIDEWCEALLSVAPDAYEATVGDDWTFSASVSYETGSNRAQW